MDKIIYDALPVFKVTKKEADMLADVYDLIGNEEYFFICNAISHMFYTDKKTILLDKIAKSLRFCHGLWTFLYMNTGLDLNPNEMVLFRLKWIEKIIDYNGYELVDDNQPAKYRG